MLYSIKISLYNTEIFYITIYLLYNKLVCYIAHLTDPGQGDARGPFHLK